MSDESLKNLQAAWRDKDRKPKPVPFWLAQMQSPEDNRVGRNRIKLPVAPVEIAHPSYLPDRLADHAFDRTTRDLDYLSRIGMFKHYPALLDPNQRRGLRVLDVPTGTGKLVYDLREKGVRADGIDMLLEPSQIEPFFTSGVMEDLSTIPDQTYDVCVSFWGPFSYNYKGFDTYTAVKELKRVTKPGGSFIIGPLRQSDKEWLLDAAGRELKIQEHIVTIREFGTWGGDKFVETITLDT